MTSSGVSPRSSLRVTAIVVCALALLVTAAAWLCFKNGWILYYGDAESHLNISRGLIDSRTPGYVQLGTVWLPVLHLICLPFVSSDELWWNGLAGTLPVAVCFIITGTCFYLAARETYQSVAAGLVVVACFALNPNVLYLAAIPMTELVFLAGVAVVLLAVLRYRSAQRTRWIAVAIVASWILSLTRYDGWFLIPFIGVWLAASARRAKWLVLIAFGIAASLAPACWIAHNWLETGNALDFYNGPYSPRAIQGGKPYPGYRDWLQAAHYYFTACKLCTGPALIALGILGVFFAWRRALWQPLLFLLLTPLFYVWSIHSSGGTPIFVPSLWPFSYYNTRYGIAALPLCAFAAGAIGARARRFALAVPVIAILPWIIHPAKENWICWKESQVNSVDRRAWTQDAAQFMHTNYVPRQAILASAGDVTGVFRKAHIPLRETINIGNGPLWFAATRRPDLYHPGTWLVRQRGDLLDRLLARAQAPYRPVLSISTRKYSPDLLIDKRSLR